MFRNVIFFDNFTSAVTNTWRTFLFQGILLILLGVIIYLYPELLVAMISATFIILGILFIALAFHTRGIQGQYSKWRDQFWEP